MTIETINVGTSPNDGTGSSLRSSFIICNNNFSYLSSISGNGSGTITANIIAVTVQAATIGNSGAILTGTLSTAAQTNITSLGTLTGLTLSGTLTGTTINAATIGNSGAVLTGTLSTAAQTNVTSLGTLSSLSLATNSSISGTGLDLSTVRFLSRSASNLFGTNHASISNITLSTTSTRYSQITSDDVNVNVTVNYTGTITAGFQRYTAYRNVKASGNVYVTLPNSNNNKGTNLIPILASTTAFFTFTAFDSTSANVAVQIVNT
jgi:hypothetical protein